MKKVKLKHILKMLEAIDFATNERRTKNEGYVVVRFYDDTSGVIERVLYDNRYEVLFGIYFKDGLDALYDHACSWFFEDYKERE